MLYNVLGLFSTDIKISNHLLPLVIVLSLFTGFNWSINELLPDVFTSVGFLSLICIFFRNRPAKRELLLFILFFLSAASHISNVFIYLFLLFGILIFKKQLGPLDPKFFKVKFFISLGLLILSYLIMASAISKSKQVFFAGSMAEKGILQEVLKNNCRKIDFKLCPYKDSIPQSFEYFVWNKKSPLYKIGDWKTSRQELKEIIHISFTDWKYISMHLSSTLFYFSKQLVTFDIGEGNGAYKEDNILIKRIAQYSLWDDEWCQATKQRAGAFLKLDLINHYYRLTTALSFVVFFLLFVLNYRKLNSQLRVLIYLVLSLLLISSLLVAFSSEVSNRHGCKLVWLITLLNFLIVSKMISLKKIIC